MNPLESTRLTTRAILEEWHLHAPYELAVDFGSGEPVWVMIDRSWASERHLTVHFGMANATGTLTFPADQEVEIRRPT